MGIEPASRHPAVIRLLEPSDAEAYRRLRIEAAREPGFGASTEIETEHPLRLLRRTLMPGDSGFILGACVNDRLVGMVGFGSGPDRQRGTLYGLFVSRPARRLGIGAGLVRAMPQHVPAPIKRIELFVAGTNTDAIRLYEQEGYARAAAQSDGSLKLVLYLQDQAACS